MSGFGLVGSSGNGQTYSGNKREEERRFLREHDFGEFLRSTVEESTVEESGVLSLFLRNKIES